jgi:two-component system, OmpR family, response regulator ChvI
MKKRILLVDDEPDITITLKMGLECNEGNQFEVDTFNDAIEGLSNYKADHYDLLLLDIKMPNMNGFELYREIRKRDDKVKICFLTAFEDYNDEFKKIFPKLDAESFASKPISIYDLAKRIKKVLNNNN